MVPTSTFALEANVVAGMSETDSCFSSYDCNRMKARVFGFSEEGGIPVGAPSWPCQTGDQILPEAAD